MYPYVLTCLLCLLARTTWAEPACDARKKVAIVDGIHFKTEGLRTTVREADHFYKVLVQKLTAKGWSPVTPPVSQALCAGAKAGDCLAYITRASGAAYALRLLGEGNLKHGYSLHIEVYSPKTKHYQRSSNVCDVCLTDDIGRSTAELSIELLADAVKDDDETQRESERRADPAPLVETRALPAVPSKDGRAHLWIPWSMVAVGAVGAGLGAWWLYEDGRSKDFQASSPVISDEYYASRSLGVASLVGGLALVAGGTLWLLVTPSSTVGVSASPSHVALGLRY